MTFKKPETEQPAQDQYRAILDALAKGIDEIVNAGATKPEDKLGFALLMFPFGEKPDGRINYISNAQREDMLVAMKEFISRNEGRYFEPVNKQ